MISITLLLIFILALNVLPNAVSMMAVAGIIITLITKYENILKRSYIYYILAFVLGGMSIFFYQETYFEIITSGVIGYGFFFVVMFVGILPNKYGISRAIKKYRGELSILGFILITPHAFLHAFGFFNSIDLFGIATYVVMIPLTLVSFKIIKREIELTDWIKIQKAAYLIYGLLFVHLLIVADWENKLVYAVLLALYVNNKLLKELKK